MAKRLAELGALQDAVSNDESSPKRLALAGYIRGLFLDWSANPYNPLSRLTARGRLLGYFWDSGAIGLSMNFADQNYLVKDGTVQSKSFSQIVNFSRTTNATVTNSAGQITYAPHNLLTYSEQFDNGAWTKTTTTVSANAIASPVSTTTGDTLTAGGANSTTLHSYTAIAQPYTFSIYIRRRTGTGTIEITADGSTYVAKTITSDWARYDTTITPTAGTRTPGVRIVTSGDAIDVWGAQLEIGSTATTYNSTTVKNLLGYSELFDNAAWTKSNSFVQTNSVIFSEAFDNAAWTKGNITVSANLVNAPNGYQTADLLIPNTNNLNHYTLQASGAPNISQGTYSAYFKAAGYTKVALRESVTSGSYASFNLNTGTVIELGNAGTSTASNATITSIGNGWYRCSVTITFATSTPQNIGIWLLSDSYTTGNPLGVTFIGDGTSGIYAWGAQLVQGTDAGAYRRTDSTSLPCFYPNHNGVVCAEKLVENTATSSHAITQSVTASNIKYTLSVYAKAAENSWLLLSAGVDSGTYFNLFTGVLGIVGTSSTASIVPVGNGWYRCSITFEFPTSGSKTCYIFTTTANNTSSYAGNGTSGIYIFGAQLSDSASLDPYVLNAGAAPTAAAYYGARFDYDPVTLLPKGLLIEEQRANLVLQSGFAGAVAGTPGTAPTYWTLAVSGGTTNALVSDGLGGNIISFTTVAARQFLTQSVSVSANTTYTASVYINGNTGNVYQSIFAIAALPAGATVTYYANGALVTVASYVPLAGDRLTAIIVISATAGTVIPRIGIGAGGNDTGTVSFSKIQLEAGAFATSYIPTAASQVTRAADVATIQGSNFYSWYNQNEGSIVTNAQKISLVDAAPRIYSISDGSNSNRLTEVAYTSDLFFVSANGSAQADLDSGDYQQAVFAKQANAYKVNEFASAFNNGTVATDVSGITPIVNRLNLGVDGDLATGRLSGHIKQISYYPQKLSDSVLKGLTA